MAILSYLRFRLSDQADLDAFASDVASMRKLAAEQPGYRWAEVGQDPADPRVWIVVSEWDDVEQVRAWEHHPDHEALYDVWEPHYREPFVHRRFVPWVRPEGEIRPPE
ncbi:MAG TPA: antibiotic biosynthesis monooxygenase family protein [Actinomycetota bacterium]|nr:antibiotic biosynthesis monooxygenase family protein [Actinomycetota bacterium]